MKTDICFWTTWCHITTVLTNHCSRENFAAYNKKMSLFKLINFSNHMEQWVQVAVFPENDPPQSKDVMCRMFTTWLLIFPVGPAQPFTDYTGRCLLWGCVHEIEPISAHCKAMLKLCINCMVTYEESKQALNYAFLALSCITTGRLI